VTFEVISKYTFSCVINVWTYWVLTTHLSWICTCGYFWLLISLITLFFLHLISQYVVFFCNRTFMLRNTCYSRLMTQFSKVILIYLWIPYLLFPLTRLLVLTEPILMPRLLLISAYLNWCLALNVTPLCSNCILSEIHFLVWCSLPLHS